MAADARSLSQEALRLKPDERTWQQHAALAEHYLASSLWERYLYTPGLDDKPWHLVERVGLGPSRLCTEAGGEHLDIWPSVEFKAKHESGLTFVWEVRLYDAESKEPDGEIFKDCMGRLRRSQHAGQCRDTLGHHFKSMVTDILDCLKEQEEKIAATRKRLWGGRTALADLGLIPSESLDT